MIRPPTDRQLEILRLRCQLGLSLSQIAAQLGIRRNSVGMLAAVAATRLIRSEPTPENAGDRDLALEHYPEIAARFAKPAGGE